MGEVLVEIVLEIFGGWFLSGASDTLKSRTTSSGVKLFHFIVLNGLYFLLSVLFVFLLLKFQETGLKFLFIVLLLGDAFLIIKIWYTAVRYMRL